VMQAFYLLEDRGLVRARPRSGYYVNAHWRSAPEPPPTSSPSSEAAEVDVADLVFEVLASVRRRDVVPLGSAFPSPELFPLDKLATSLGKSARRLDPWRTVEALSPGSTELRRQIAKRYSALGLRVLPEEIVVTAGALESLNLCLRAATRPGDVVAIESPAFYAALQAVEHLGLRAVQVATHPGEGVDLGSLEPGVGERLRRQLGQLRLRLAAGDGGQLLAADLEQQVRHPRRPPPPSSGRPASPARASAGCTPAGR